MLAVSQLTPPAGTIMDAKTPSKTYVAGHHQRKPPVAPTKDAKAKPKILGCCDVCHDDFPLQFKEGQDFVTFLSIDEDGFGSDTWMCIECWCALQFVDINELY